MKYIILHIILAFFLVSCDVYKGYYYSLIVNSTNAQPNNYQELVYVGSNYEVAHSFLGINIPIIFRVYNDDDVNDLKVDWKSSFIVVEEDTIRFSEASSNMLIKSKDFQDFEVKGKNYEQLMNSVRNVLAQDVLIFSQEANYNFSNSHDVYINRFTKQYSPLKFQTHVKLIFIDDKENEFYAVSSFWTQEIQVIKTDKFTSAIERLEKCCRLFNKKLLL